MNLYSRRKLLTSVAAILVCALGFTSFAQRRKAHKLRATAVVEMTTDSAGIVVTRVFPVTILDEGHFHDASIYKAAPRPMAIEPGIVYEGQTSGEIAGYATILSSTNNKGWTALAKWQPFVATKKPEAAPTVNSGDDQRPILRRGDSTPAPSSTPDKQPASPTSTPAPVENNPGTEDADRPVLRRRTPEKAEPTPTPATAATPAGVATPAGTTPSSAGVVPPTKIPIFTAGTRTLAAISDTEPTDSRSFNFQWKPGEEHEMEGKIRKLALAQLPHENAQLTPNSLKNISMRAFDLDLSNDATIVFSAEIPGSYLAPGSKGAPGKFVSRWITVIARVDIDGAPQKLAASVTDSTRLDVAPRLEFIDAVDVDGDGLAELLFREYSFDETSYIIYGVGRSTVTKVFEGASTRLPGKN